MNTTDNRTFAERMADPKTAHDEHVRDSYKADVERNGRTWSDELERLKRKDAKR